MIEIDGSEGEGGGQIVRSSLALAAITGKSFCIANVRAGRKKTGLKRQHLTCVKAARTICGAETEGEALGSGKLTFVPGKVTSGAYKFSIGTAGSTILVAQTVLPALMLAEGDSKVTVEGGTHNDMAPFFEFFARTYLPFVNQLGPTVSANLESHGFYPNGGGVIQLSIQPASRLHGIELLERSGQLKPTVRAIVSALPLHIAEREVDTVRRRLGWPTNSTDILNVDSPKGPGNAVIGMMQFDNVCECVMSLGRRGVTAEQVAKRNVKSIKNYLESDMPVGEHLADQLLLPMGLAAARGSASRFRTVPLTEHSRTHIRILKMFLDIDIRVTEIEGGVQVDLNSAEP